MQVKYYKTEWENDRELIDDDVKNHLGLKPRIMHITDKWFHGSVWVVAIVVWE